MIYLLILTAPTIITLQMILEFTDQLTVELHGVREGKDFPFVPVMDFDYVEIGLNRYLRAATHGRSAFETDLDMIVPVELVSFAASIVDGSVELTWTTATETNNMGFEIERSIIIQSSRKWDL
jgi:hypothetical protein